MNSKRALVLLTDAFGGNGGIAKFNRDFLTAWISHPEYEEIVVLPRLAQGEVGEIPARLRWVANSANSKLRYIASVARLLLQDRNFGIVICGHINLLPLAWAARAATNAPLILVIHGVDAWRPHKSSHVNLLLRRVDYVIAVSEITKERFSAWSGFPAERVFILPNCVDMQKFRPMSRNPKLTQRYGLVGRTVLMTLARLDSRERYKGIDQILDVMPSLIVKRPDLVYLIVGDGDDRSRLAEKANALGVNRNVIFAGYIPEEEKVDHYNLADVFAMPGRGEGFGIVYLEAMACGVPVIASSLDGSREAVGHGSFGIVVNPDDQPALIRCTLDALSTPRGTVPHGLDYFSFPKFVERMHNIMNRLPTS